MLRSIGTTNKLVNAQHDINVGNSSTIENNENAFKTIENIGAAVQRSVTQKFDNKEVADSRKRAAGIFIPKTACFYCDSLTYESQFSE